MKCPTFQEAAVPVQAWAFKNILKSKENSVQVLVKKCLPE